MVGTRRTAVARAARVPPNAAGRAAASAARRSTSPALLAPVVLDVPAVPLLINTALLELERVRLVAQIKADAERLRWDWATHKACLANLTAPPVAPTPLPAAAAAYLSTKETLGELIRSPKVAQFQVLFPAVPAKQLVHVWKWLNLDYNVAEIYKLLGDNSFDTVDDSYKTTVSLGHGLSITKKKASAKDYPLLAVWSKAFLL